MTCSEASGLAISDLATIEVKLYLGVHREEGASSLNSYHLNMAIYVQKLAHPCELCAEGEEKLILLSPFLTT